MIDPEIIIGGVFKDEFGDINNKDYYYYIKSYSPYAACTNVEYPNILIISGYNDDRALYWHGVKYAN